VGPGLALALVVLGPGLALGLELVLALVPALGQHNQLPG